jgi:hypothetical protein
MGGKGSPIRVWGEIQPTVIQKNDTDDFSD